jgi:hypothetical protein
MLTAKEPYERAVLTEKEPFERGELTPLARMVYSWRSYCR